MSIVQGCYLPTSSGPTVRAGLVFYTRVARSRSGCVALFYWYTAVRCGCEKFTFDGGARRYPTNWVRELVPRGLVGHLAPCAGGFRYPSLSQNPSSPHGLLVWRIRLDHDGLGPCPLFRTAVLHCAIPPGSPSCRVNSLQTIPPLIHYRLSQGMPSRSSDLTTQE